MFRKICLHHQAIKSIYLFLYNGRTLTYRKSISLKNKLYHKIYLFIYLFNWVERRKEIHFPIGTEIQYN